METTAAAGIISTEKISIPNAPKQETFILPRMRSNIAVLRSLREDQPENYTVITPLVLL